MEHPLDVHTKVQALIDSCKTCGGIKRRLIIEATVSSYKLVDGMFVYSLSSGHEVPQIDIQQVIS